MILVFVANIHFAKAQHVPDTLQDNSIYELGLEELLSISVVSASKVEQKPSDAPNIIYAASKDLVEGYGWNSLNEMLSFYSGFFRSRDYERRTLGFRGMFESWNNNHLLMLVDGIPINDNLYGTAYTWEITPLNFSNSAEIICGPGGALYGSNAMNGVITLNTLTVNDINRIGNARIRFGSHNYQYYDVVTGAENDDFGIIASFSHSNTDGNEYMSLDASDRVDEFGNPLKFRINDSRSNSYLFTKIYGKNLYEGLMFQYHEQRWDFQTGHGWVFRIPDRPEDMKEYRRIFALKYAPERVGKKLNYEFTSRFQIHGVDWDLRLYPNGGFGGAYPNGVSEYLDTDAKDLFFRAQLNYQHKNHNVIFGAENSVFFYNGDHAHNSNVNLNYGGKNFDDDYYELNPWLEYIYKKPVYNIASYLQYISPKLFDRIQITASGRFDRMFFDYNDTLMFNSSKSKHFQMFTPRVAMVYTVRKNLLVKAIYGRAFRTPSPTEMFGLNTDIMASNIDKLKPESITNIDVGAVWKPLSTLNIQLNTFWVNYENQIAYSVANANLITNIYSLKTVGVELAAQYASQNFSGFANASYSQRIDENILDTTITKSDSRITWAPSLLVKAGAFYRYNRFTVSSLFYYQNKVYRRSSDKFDNMENYRPNNYVDGWFSIDFKGTFRFNKKSEIGISVKNAFDAERYLIKNNQYKFDYRLDSRTFMFEFRVTF
ncbi:MAG: TonB-dependent receptor [Bacteroidales bacterium]